MVELQIQLDEVRDKYKAIARSTNAKAHNKKMQTLEYNLGQLNEVQRGVSAHVRLAAFTTPDVFSIPVFQLVYQNTSLKKDLNTAERKLLERKERIVNLERLVAQSENQLRMKEQEFQRISRELHEQLSAAHGRDGGFPTGAGIGFGRIAKPLRGGGGGNMLGVESAGAFGMGSSSGSALGRLASEDSGGGEFCFVVQPRAVLTTPVTIVAAKRQSWFFSKG